MATQNGDTKSGAQTKSGGAGGTPLAVTQEDCLVITYYPIRLDAQTTKFKIHILHTKCRTK